MDLMSTNLILFNCKASTKEEAIKAIADAMDSEGRLTDKELYISDVIAREGEASTAIGYSFATPHAKSDGVKEPSLGFIRFANPIKWDDESDDVSMVFQIAVPKDGGEKHLEILATIFRNLIHEDFRKKLGKANSEQEIIDLINSI